MGHPDALHELAKQIDDDDQLRADLARVTAERDLFHATIRALTEDRNEWKARAEKAEAKSDNSRYERDHYVESVDLLRTAFARLYRAAKVVNEDIAYLELEQAIDATPESVKRMAEQGDDPLHPNGRCTCCGEGSCDWCVRTNASLDDKDGEE